MSSVDDYFLLDTVTELGSCLLTIHNDPERLDGVVVRLGSIISALSLVCRANASWEIELLNLLVQANTILMNHLDNCSIVSSSNRFSIARISLETLLSLNFSVPKISTILGCSLRTVQRRMEDFGLRITDTYTQITDEQLEIVVLSILVQQPNTGYKRMKGHLASRGIKVTQRRLIDTMKSADPMGVYQRTVQRNRTIRRRQYFVKYSNEIWHIDANLKLVRWGFVIRAGIDGKSRTAIYVSVSSDNRSDTHLESFLDGVAKWGLPLRTRTDKGKENIAIAKCMIENRGTGRSSHICGRSVHNQRVERFWRDLSEGCMSPYYNLFCALEEDGHLNVDNIKQLYLLHYVFIPRLNSSAQEFVAGWNCHPLSTEHNMTPIQIMAANLFPAQYDTSITDLVDHDNGELMISEMEDLDLLVDHDTVTSSLEILNVLSEEESARLQTFICTNTQNLMEAYNIFVDLKRRVLLE